MKKITLFLCVYFFAVGLTPAFSMTIEVWEVTNKNISKINDWIEAQIGSIHVLEDFEDFNQGWYTQKDTGVGTFKAEGRSGKGATSYPRTSRTPYFSIQDRTTDWYGRSNTTTGEDASHWLDSGDITLLTLAIKDLTLTNLFFYIQDPADFSQTTLTAKDSNNVATNYIFSNETNKASFFVGISWSEDEILSTLSWKTKSRSDGFGLDDFSTIHNPEPATMLLLGFGLIGLAGISRKII